MTAIVSIGLCQLISYFLFYYFNWLITNRYDPDIVGTFYLAFAYAFGAYTLVKWGWGQAVLRYCSKLQIKQAQLSELFLSHSIRKVLRRGIIFSFLIVVISSLLSHLHKMDLLETALYGLIPFVIFKPLNELTIQYLRVSGRLTLFSILQYIIGPAGKILFVIFLIHIYSEKIWSISYGVSAAEIVVAFLCIVIIWNKLDKKWILKISQLSLDEQELKNFTNQIGLNLILLYGLMRADVIYAAIWLTEADVAAYQVARHLSNIVAMSLIFFEPFVSPSIARLLGSNKNEELKKGFKLSIYFLTLITIPPAALLFIYPEYVLSFFGKFYEGAALPLRFLVVGQMINVLTGQSGYVLSMGGHSKHVLANAIFIIALTFCLMTVMVSSMGTVGAAAAFTVSMISVNILRIWQIKKLENVDWINYQQIMKLLAWFGFAVCLFYFAQFFILNAYLLGVCLAVYYTTFLIYHYFLRRYELNEFISIFLPSSSNGNQV